MGGNNSKIHKSPLPDVTIPKISVPEFSLSAWEKHPEKIAAVHGDTTVTFKQLAADIRRFASGLQKQFGFGKGDVLALDSPNSIEWIVVFYGTLMAGGIVTPLNPISTAMEITHQLQDSKPKFAVTSAEAKEKLMTAKADVPSLSTLITVLPEGSPAPEGCSLFTDILKAGDDDFKGVNVSPSDLAVLPYSSGTTGAPKGVMLTHYNLVANCCQNSGQLADEISADNSSLVAVLPFFHIYGMQIFLLCALNAGAKLCIMSKFDPKEFLTILVKHKVTAAFVVPPIVNFMAKHPALESVLEQIKPNLRTVLSGAAPLGTDLGAALEKRLANGCKIKQGYGMTELSPVTHVTPEALASPDNCGAAGVLVPNTQMKIVKDDGKLAGVNEQGEVCVRGPQVMKGYLNNPQATKDMIVKGWLHTGDVGYIDEQGMMVIVDRCKELIKVKGLQVPPAEVEAVLQGHPAVADVAVIGIPDERCGELPKAFIVPKDAAKPPSLDDILEYIKDRLAPYKAPGSLEIVETIPKSASGKILRRLLRGSS